MPSQRKHSLLPHPIQSTGPKHHNADHHAPCRRHHPARRRPQHLVPGNDATHGTLHDIDDEALLFGHAEHIPQRRGRGRVRAGLPLDLPREAGLVGPREEAPGRRADVQGTLDVSQLASIRVSGRPAAEGELEEEGAALAPAKARAAGAHAQLGDLGTAPVARLPGSDVGWTESVREGRHVVGLAHVGPGPPLRLRDTETRLDDLHGFGPGPVTVIRYQTWRSMGLECRIS
ncbi:hypothetical protein PG984_011803 [Apiospora sp. TS-2023a]